MACRTEIDPAQRLATVVVERGPHPLPEALGELQSLADNPAFGPGAGVLLDVRDATTAPTYDEAQRLARACGAPSVLGGHPVALLTAGAVYSGVGCILSAMAELAGGVSKAFTDADEAHRWLEWQTAHARAPDRAT